LTSHFLSWVGWIINERVWARIPNDLKPMVLEEAIAAGDFMTEKTNAGTEDLIKRFQEAGLTVVRDVNFPAMQKATESVYSAIPNWSPGLHGRVKQILTN